MKSIQIIETEINVLILIFSWNNELISINFLFYNNPKYYVTSQCCNVKMRELRFINKLYE